MTTEDLTAFATALSRYRLTTGLTQEELAERANLSVRGISDLERGINKSPRAHTVRQLADALQLSTDDRALFERAARAATSVPAIPDALPGGNFLGALPAGRLVARDEESERIRSILAAVTEGAGQLVLLSGEVGVGKTRLLQEFMADARGQGMLVLTGRCYAAEQETSYYPFLEALGGVAASMPGNVRTEGQRGWKRAQQLIAAASSASLDAVEQQQLFGTVTDLLLLLARSVPLALLLDDLQWADSASLKLLQDLARTTRNASVLLAGAFRDLRLGEEHPNLAQTLQLLSRERLAERITVGRLSLEETTALVAIAMDQEAVSEEFAHFVYRRTKGIPRLIDQLVRSLGGRLELQGEIGAGAMGRVFRALDRTTEQTVAAKLVLARQEIDLDALLRFQQEGAVLARLDHPHIVRIYDTFVEEHASCIIMELLDGQSLGAILQQGPLPLPRAKALALQVADALAYAHSQQIVHRDIKPDNVMVLPEDQVKVTDFGIARILQPDTSLQTIATTGMRMGTPLYMAPEQIEGKTIDGRTDIYALGAMLYHMVTGWPPFEGSDALAVAVKHLQEEPVPPSQIDPGIPADWDALILKAMTKDPAKRFHLAREMGDALAALGEQAARRILPNAQSRRIATAAGMLTLVVAVLAGVWTHVATGSRQASTGSRIDTYLNGLAAHAQLSGTVFVAQRGKILLDKGYGMADRKDRVPNGPTTKYPVGGVAFSMSLVAALKLEEQGKFRDRDHICAFLSSCPRSWRPITIRMVLDGTSGLPAAFWGVPGHTPAQTLAGCEATPLTAPPGARLNYQNCAVVVLGTIIQKVTGMAWATTMRQLILGPAGMVHSGRMTNSLLPPARAQAYSGTSDGSGNAYNDYFPIYSTARDVYAYDRALFAGRLVSQSSLKRIVTPRDLVSPPDEGVVNARTGYKWKVGTVDGHRAVYTSQNSFSFSAANFYLPREEITIVVISNDDQNDVEAIAEHVTGLVAGRVVVAHVPPAKAITATIKVPRGSAVAAGGGALWVGGDQTGLVTRINPTTNKIVARIRINDPATASGLIDAGNPQLTSGSGQLWATDRVHKTVVRIDPATNTIVARVRIGIEPGGLAIAGHSLWVESSWDDEPGVYTIVRVDLRSERVVATITNAITDLGEPFQLTATPDALWFSDWAGGTIKRLDAATNKVVATLHAGVQPGGIAVGEGSIWTATHHSNVVSRIDPVTTKVVARIPLNGYPSNASVEADWGGVVTVGAGSVWAVAGSANRTLVRIDPYTNQVTASVTFPQRIWLPEQDVAGGSVWVASGENETWQLYRIDPRAMK